MSRLPSFELHGPTTVEEASALLEGHGADAALYAGGTELLLLLKLGFAHIRHLVDVKGIAELRGIESDAGGLTIGAAVTHRELERSRVVRETCPALARMEGSVANSRVRNAGTIGGNLCFSDPHSDPATFLLAADAELLVRRGGEPLRRIPAADFVRGPYQTALQPGELLVGVRIPAPPPDTVIVHRKLAFRERPAVTVTCLVRMALDRVAECRIAVGSVGPVPARASAAEGLLAELDVDSARQAVEQVGRAAADRCEATDDANGSAEYKRHLVSVLVKRALGAALAGA